MIRWLAADGFLTTLTNYRILSLTGRVGGGKTSLAVILASWLVNNDYVSHIVSDISIPGGTYPPPFPLKNSAILLDETWRLIKSGTDVLDYAAYMRKLNNYLLMPSNLDVPTKIMFFQAWRVWNFYVIGVPMWMYGWKVTSKSIAEKGFFYIINPHEVFGLYDTFEIQDDDGGIARGLAATIQAEKAKYKRTPEIITPDFDELRRRADVPAGVQEEREQKKKKQGIPGMKALGQKLDNVVGELADAANSSRDSAERITDAVKRIKR